MQGLKGSALGFRLGSWTGQEVAVEERSFVAALLRMTAKGGWCRGDRIAAEPPHFKVACPGSLAAGGEEFAFPVMSRHLNHSFESQADFLEKLDGCFIFRGGDRDDAFQS